MAQLNITLNQEEILLLLSNSREDAFRTLLSESLNSILQAESTAQLGAQPYERSATRSDSRNGIRERPLKTRIGTITLAVPRHRDKPFHTLVFENYSRSEAALVTTMAEMVVNGVSTRKVATVMQTLCGTSYSKSTVSEACKGLDEAVNSFKTRPLQDNYDFLYVDATYFKVRGEHRIVSKAMMVALAITDEGGREIVGFDIYDNESKETWKLFLESLRDRGLRDLKMITSDAHDGIIYAISKIFPNTPWQRCQTHFSRDILSYAPAKYQKAIHAGLLEMYHSKTLDEARILRNRLIEEYAEVAGKAMECLDDGFEDAMMVMALPEGFRKYLRTSNHLERLNKELKRRSSVIGVFPNEGSLNRIIGTVLMELNGVYSLEQKLNVSSTQKAQLKECVPTLMMLAKEQQHLFAA